MLHKTTNTKILNNIHLAFTELLAVWCYIYMQATGNRFHFWVKEERKINDIMPNKQFSFYYFLSFLFILFPSHIRNRLWDVLKQRQRHTNTDGKGKRKNSIVRCKWIGEKEEKKGKKKEKIKPYKEHLTRMFAYMLWINSHSIRFYVYPCVACARVELFVIIKRLRKKEKEEGEKENGRDSCFNEQITRYLQNEWN